MRNLNPRIRKCDDEGFCVLRGSGKNEINASWHNVEGANTTYAIISSRATEPAPILKRVFGSDRIDLKRNERGGNCFFCLRDRETFPNIPLFA